MNTKKLLPLIALLLFALSACNKSQKLTDAIPADASCVIYLDTKSLVEKSEYDIFSNSTVQQGINIYKVFLKDDAKLKLLDDFLKDANSVGLDLKGESYIYANNEVGGLIVPVNDANKVKNFFLSFNVIKEDNIKKDGDIYSFSLAPNVLVAWDETRFTCLMDQSILKTGSATSLSELALSYLKQNADKSINTNKAYAEFIQTKKDISIFSTNKGFDKLLLLGELSNIRFTDFFFVIADVISNVEGVYVGLNTSFEKGEVLSTSNYYFDTPDAESNFKEQMSNVLGTLNGEHLKYIQTNPLLLVSSNIKGNGIYNNLSNFGALEELNSEMSKILTPEQIKELVKNFTGDVTFSVLNFEKQQLKMSEYDMFTDSYIDGTVEEMIPQCVFFADVKDPALLLPLIKEQLDKNKQTYTEIAPSKYSISLAGIELYFGANGNTFFTTNVKSVYDKLIDTSLKNNYLAEIKNKSLIVQGDSKILNDYILANGGFGNTPTLLSDLSEYSLTISSDNFNGNAKIEFADKNKNGLAIMCQHIDKLMGGLGSLMKF